MLFTDVNGNIVTVNRAEVHKVVFSDASSFTVFGMDMRSIGAMRQEYLRRGGKERITPATVAKTFKKEKDNETA